MNKYNRRRKYKTKKRKQKEFATKVILLLIFIGCIIGAFLFLWKTFGLGIVEEQPTEPVVCIDPGHGGADVGAVGPNNRYEKDDNLALALAVREQLESRGIQVLMTREDDSKLSLQDRCYIANKAEALLFVSIHRNSAESKSANGMEIWTANSGIGYDMASYIFEGLKVVGMQSDRGIQEGTSDSRLSDYYVNKHTTMPSCLLEMGFITNEEDNRLFDTNLEQYARAIADGIEKMMVELQEQTESPKE